MKNLAELQAECQSLGLTVVTSGRPNKDSWIKSLQIYHWEHDHPGVPLSPQIQPMLLSDWQDLTPEDAETIENDQHHWLVQEKKNGIRAMVHIEAEGIRITGRNISETKYRLTEHQENVPHLASGLNGLSDTILDAELVCPAAEVNTGDTITQDPLQAAVAILATSSGNAQAIQTRHDAHLRLCVFDILKSRGVDVTAQPLWQRLDLLRQTHDAVNNPYIEIVPGMVVGKPNVHRRVLDEGGEGTVWKRLDQPYDAGRRVRHWIKRKRAIQIEAIVSGFKPGSAERGNRNLVGAVEFSSIDGVSNSGPIAWVSSWTDDERKSMTAEDVGGVKLQTTYYGRRAIIAGHDIAARSGRIRHARLVRWL